MRNYISSFVSIILVAFLSFHTLNVNAQCNTLPLNAGTYTIPGSGCTGFPTINAAITYINTYGIANNGNVIFSIAGGYAETAPTSGYTITASGTATSNIIFQKASGVNPVITAGLQPAGSYLDAVIKLVGADYITINNLTIKENAKNTVLTPATNTMTEWGIALLHASKSNGAQYNTIQSNVISLNKSYQNSFGIYSNNKHFATNAATSDEIIDSLGRNSYNKIYADSINNVNTPIVFIGSSGAGGVDVGNDIGGSSISTANVITNWGSTVMNSGGTVFLGMPSVMMGIYMLNQSSFNVSRNILTSATGLFSSTTGAGVKGIYCDYNLLPSVNIINNINYNTINLSSADSTGSLEGISYTSSMVVTATSGTVLNATYNTITTSLTSASATSVVMKGIVNTFPWDVLNISNNTLRSNTTTATTGGAVGISNTAAIKTSTTIDYNKFGDLAAGFISFSKASSGAVYMIQNTGGAATDTLNIRGNDFRSITFSVASTGSVYFISNTAATFAQTITGNTFTGISLNVTTGSVYFISNSVTLPAGGKQVVSSNSVVTSFVKTGSGGSVYFYNNAPTASSSTASITCSNNNFSNMTFVGSTIYGWQVYDAGPANKVISNNIFSNIIDSTTGVFYVIYANGTTAAPGTIISGNTISNIKGYSTQYGIFAGSVASGIISVNGNNQISSLIGMSTGAVYGIYSNSPNITIASNQINTVSSGGTIYGIYAGSGTGSITSNSLNNITHAGAASIYGIAGSLSNLTIGSNVLANFTSSSTSTAGMIYGIYSSSGTTNVITGNIVNGFHYNGVVAATATSAVAGVYIASGTNVSVLKNNIYNLKNSSNPNVSATIVNGIWVAAGTAVTVANNFVSDLKAPASVSVEAIRGISITSATAATNYYIYHNTVFLNATSTGANFGTSGIYHANSVTSTTATLTLRNNIIDNRSVPNGTGLAVAYRRSATGLANYAVASNNNLFFADSVNARHLIYYDGTNADSTLAAYKARGAFDANSISVAPSYINIAAIPYDLHLQAGINCGMESGGTGIATITDDIDGELRSSSTPDMGADEFGGALASSAAVLSGNTTVCSGSTINMKVDITGGTSPFTVVYTNGTTNYTVSNYNSGANIARVMSSSAIYTLVSVTSTGGCLGTGNSGQAVITVNPLPVVTVTGNLTACGSTTLTAAATGAITYSWNGGTTPASYINTFNTSGTYTVTATDANGCSGTSSQLVKINPLPVVSATASATTTCAGTAINLYGNATGNVGVGDTVVLGFQGFESTGSTLGYSVLAGGTCYGGSAVFYTNGHSVRTGTTNTIYNSSGGSFTYPSSGVSGFIDSISSNRSSGTNSNCLPTGATLQFSNLNNLNLYKSKSISFRLANVSSTNSSAYFNDMTAFVSVEVSLNNGNTYSQELLLKASNSTNNGTYWGYNATGIASTTFDGNNVPTTFTPSSAGIRTTDGYSKLEVKLPDTCSVVSFRIMLQPAAQGVSSLNFSAWIIDDVKITGVGSRYSWYSNPAGFTSTLQNPTGIIPSATTNYFLTVTDSLGCSASASVTDTVNTVTAGAIGTAQTICSGQAPATLSSTTNGSGTGTITYRWESAVSPYTTWVQVLGATGATYAPGALTASTQYRRVAISTLNGVACSATSAAVQITVKSFTSVMSGSITVCQGTSANIRVTITGNGVSPYTVVYNNGLFNTTVTSYVSGANIPVYPSATTTYSIVSVTDATGCAQASSSGTAVVTVNNGSSSSVFSGTQSICAGTSANLKVAITGGTSPYTVQYFDGTTAYTVSNYLSGSNILVTPAATKTYSLLSVVSANTCVGDLNSGTPVVTVVAKPSSAVISGNANICLGSTASINVDVVGGVSPYTVVYKDNSTQAQYTVSNYVSGSAIAVSPAVSTSYSLVSVTGTGGCLATSNSGTASVNVVSSLTTNQVVSICQGSSYSLPWGGVVSNAGTYTRTYTSVQGCDSTANITLIVMPSYVTNSSIVICEGQNYTLPWGAVINTAGTYTYTYVSSMGCDSVVNINVTTTQPSSIVAVGATNQSTCVNTAIVPIVFNLNGTITSVNAIGLPAGVSGLLSGSTFTISGTPTVAGVFNFTVSATGACGIISATGTITVNASVPVSVSITSSASGNKICSGSSVTFTATATNGGTAPVYQWRLNGMNVGANSNTYTNSSLSNGDSVSVLLISNIVCSVSSTVVSNNIITTVNPIPAGATGIMAGSSCGPGSVSMYAGTSVANKTTDWYTVPTGGVAFALNSTSITTPIISTTTFYYAQIKDTLTGCVAATRNQVIATINPLPAAPTGTSATRCGTGTVTLTATPGTGETIDWYSAPTGGTLLSSTSTAYTAPSITAPGTYNFYIQARNLSTFCVSATRTVLTGTALAVPAAPTGAVSSSVCGSGTVTLSATPAASSTIDWYSNSIGDTLVSSGSSSFTTPVLNASKIYYAESRNTSTGCSSSTRLAVTATVNSLPSVAIGIDSSRCGAGVLQIGATVSQNRKVVDWYTAPSGGTPLLSNSLTYTTPSVNVTTIYYAQVRDTITGCLSGGRTPVTAVIKSLPNPLAIDASSCGPGSVTVGVTTVVGDVIYWYTKATGGVLLASNTSTFTSSVSSTTVYYAQVSNSITGCSAPARVPVSAIVNPLTSVGITATSSAVSNTICAGSSVIFTGHPVNAGSGAVYQWKLNGSYVGVNDTIYTVNSLNNQDSVWVEMISSVNCPSVTPAVSNKIKTTVNPNLPVSLNIVSNTSDTICAGTSVTFTAVPINGGASPTYQWRKNGLIISGATASTYTTNTLANGDYISCILTSNLVGCKVGSPAISNSINKWVLPTSSIYLSSGNNYQYLCINNPIIPISFTIGGSAAGVNVSGLPTGCNYALNGNVATISGTPSVSGYYHIVLATTGTCAPATASTDIYIYPTYNFTTNVSICQGRSYILPWGETVTQAGTYSHNYPNFAGCDSIENIVITVKPTYTVNNTASICQGQSYRLPWGGTATTAGVYSHTYSTVKGCDSVVNITLTVNPVYTVNNTASICQGQSYTLPWGGTATTAGVYSHTYSTVKGCDSVVNINVTVNTNLPVSVSVISVPFEGQNIVTCSNVAVTFLALPTNGGNNPLYQWMKNGFSVYGANSPFYIDSTLSSGDSITCILTSNQSGCLSNNPAISNITSFYRVNPTYVLNITDSICGNQYFLPWGELATTAGVYSHIYSTVNGCDSLVNITLTLNPVYTVNNTASICQGQTYTLPWGGSATTAGVYSHTYSTVKGCDSVVNITLNVLTIAESNTSISVSDNQLPFIWNGINYYNSGTYHHYLTNANGCDSIAHLMLTVYPALSGTTYANVCSNQLPYVWNGNAYTASGSYTKLLVSSLGTDSVVTLVLTVNAVSNGTENISVCQSQLPYSWHGQSIANAGVYFTHLLNVAGCDSLLTLNLQVRTLSNSVTNVVICPSQLPYTWNGLSINAAGTYTARFNNAQNCDSIASLILTVSNSSMGTIAGPQNVCNYSGANIANATYAINAVNASAFNWIMPTGATLLSGQGTSSISVHFAATYTSGKIKVIVSGRCSSVILSDSINLVKVAPSAPLAINGTAVQCAGLINQVYSVTSQAEVTSYNWTVPAGWTIVSGAGTNAITVTTGAVGQNGNISVSCTNSCGTSVAKTIAVSVVTANPGAPSVVSGLLNICSKIKLAAPNDTVRYTVGLPYPSGAVSFGWSMSNNSTMAIVDAASDSSWIAVRYVFGSFTSGTISVRSKSACGTGTSIKTISITTSAPTTPTMLTGLASVCAKVGTSPTDTVRYTAYGSGAIAYRWNFTGGTNALAIIVNAASDSSWIDVQYRPGFVNTTLSVKSFSDCGTSSAVAKSMSITTATPAAPTSLAGLSNVCNRVGTATTDTVRYTVGGSFVPRYRWIINGANAILVDASADSSWVAIQYLPGFSIATINVYSVGACGLISSTAKSLSITTTVPAAPTTLSGLTNVCSKIGAAVDTANYAVGAGVSGASSYRWSISTISGGASIVNAAQDSSWISVRYQYGFSGGTISVKSVSKCGLVSATAKTITLSSISTPAAPVTLNGPDNLCSLAGSANTANYTCSLVSGATAYIWTLPTGVSVVSGAGTNSIILNVQNVNAFDSISVQATVGCAASVKKTIRISNSIRSDYDVIACENYLLPWGVTVTQSGNYERHYLSAYGCDSLNVLHVTINPKLQSSLSVTQCDGYILPWGEFTAVSGAFTHVYTASTGCDSVVTVDVTIRNSTSSITDVVSCDNYTLPWGELVTSSGLYQHHYLNAFGCDSLVNVNVTINYSQSFEYSDNGCDHYSLPWGEQVSTSGDYLYHYQTQQGCDSLVIAHIVINSSKNYSYSDQGCDSYVLPWGELVTSSGDYSYLFNTSAGCDSMVVAHITINNSYQTTLNLMGCSSVSLPWGDQVELSGDYQHVYTSENGCDSLVTAHVLINYGDTVEIDVVNCIQFELPWNETAFTTGDYQRHYININGCDSLVVYHVIIHENSVSETDLETCGSYTLPWGDVADISGDYTHVFNNQYGCDSVVTIHLQLHAIESTVIEVSSCINYTLPWGEMVSSSGEYSHTYYTASGCDSLCVIKLNILPSDISSFDVVSCGEYVLPWGDLAVESGDYSYHFTNDGGCDSFVIAHVIVNHPVYHQIDISACDEYQLPWGETVAVGGDYSYSYAADNGCDSVVVIHLSLVQSTSSIEVITACDEYIWNTINGDGALFTNSGVYYNSYANENGCTHIAELDLTILHSTQSVTVVNVCPSELPYSWNGIICNASGEYRYLSTNEQGCDSVAILVFTVIENTVNEFDAIACDSYALPWGEMVAQSGDYSHHLSNAFGCDSLILVHLIVNNSAQTNIDAVACDSYVLPWGDMVTTTGDYNYTYQTVSGCDSVVTVHLQVNYSAVSEFTAVACDNYVLPWGDEVTASGDYEHHYTTVNGCDSLVTAHITINNSASSEFDVVACDAYTLPWSVEVTTSGDYNYHYTTEQGCDSLVTAHVVINYSASSGFDAVACDSYVLPWGELATVSGDYSYVYQTMTGCDSTVTVHLQVSYSSQSEYTEVACDSYMLPWGDEVTASGDYEYHYTTASGCDSLVIAHVTINYSASSEFDVVACDSYVLPWGDEVTASGDYNYHYTTEQGCDSLVMAHVTINNSASTALDASACDSYVLPWGELATVSGDYSYTYQTLIGCDSLVTVHLIVNNAIAIESYETGCDSYQLPWGESVYLSGDYSYTYTAATGCDSIVMIHLTINNTTSSEFEAVACDSYVLPWDVLVTSSGDYSYVYSSAMGCDSVVTAHIQITQIEPVNIDVESCGSYILPWGDMVDVSGDYPYHYTTEMGCDSLVILHVTINQAVLVEFNDIGCDNYLLPWGEVVNASGDYQYNYLASNGCDSLVTAHIIISYSTVTEIDLSGCDKITLPWGVDVVVSGDYQYNYTSEFGCDSLVIAHVLVNNSANSDFDVVSCDNYVLPWGQEVQQSGDYSYHYTTDAGCDSAVVVHVTINHSITNELAVAACDHYMLPWGETAEASGDYSNTYTTVAGCDSISIYHVQINYSSYTEYSDIACDTYILPWSDTVITGGDYQHIYSSQEGCDSLVLIHLTLHQSAISENTVTVCSGYILPWGQQVTSSGDYNYHYATEEGCDSNVVYHVAVGAGITEEFNATACENYVLPWGDEVTQSGDYSHVYITDQGCDSVITAHVVINHSVNNEMTIVSCNNYVLPWGEEVTSSGDYLGYYVNQYGCDSILTVHLTINYDQLIETYDMACDSFLLPWNQWVHQTGDYIMHYSSINGCDSAVWVHLTINPSTSSKEIIAACGSYDWNGTTYTASGVYTFVNTNEFGCNQTDSLMLTILTSTSSEASLTVCSGSLPYVWNGMELYDAGDYTVTLTNEAGCDSLAILHLSVSVMSLNGIVGNANACAYMGTSTLNGTFSVNASNAATYQWTLPSNAVLLSGQGTNSISVHYNSAFNAGFIKVSITDACGISSLADSMAIGKSVPVISGNILGVSNQCPDLINQVYRIDPVLDANTYTWSVPTGWTITSGQGTNEITVTTGIAGRNGSISVFASNSCGNTQSLSLPVTVVSSDPAAPVSVSGLLSVCSKIRLAAPNDTVRYQVNTAAPLGFTKYVWLMSDPQSMSIVDASGTDSSWIAVRYRFGSFASGNISVKTATYCGVGSTAKTFAISTTAPGTPQTLTGLASVCGKVGTGPVDTVVYNATLAGAVGFRWYVTGASANYTRIVAAATDSSWIAMQYLPGFSSATLSVKAMSDCGTLSATAKTLSISTAAPSAPTLISGLISVCTKVGTGVADTVRYTGYGAGALGYRWTLSGANMLIVDGASDSSWVAVQYRPGFVSGTVTVYASSACGLQSATGKSLSITTTAPTTPSTLNGLASVCTKVGTAISDTVIYNAYGVGAARYSWTMPSTYATIESAASDSSWIAVRYAFGFTSGSMSVKSVGACGLVSSAAKALSITTAAPSAPSVLNGTLSLCAKVAASDTAIYNVGSGVAGAMRYSWALTATTGGATIVSAASDSSWISIRYVMGFTGGTLSVKTVSKCGLLSTAAKSVTLTKLTAPSAPTSLSGVTTVCSYVGTTTTAAYTCTTVTGATAYIWTVPAGVTIISGLNTNSITVRFNSLASSDSISVQASTGCVLSAKKSIYLTGCIPFAKTTASGNAAADEMAIIVSPNPSPTNFVVVVNTENKHKISLLLSDAEGRKLNRYNVGPGEKIVLGSDLRPGVYMLEAVQENKKKVVRLVKF